MRSLIRCGLVLLPLILLQTGCATAALWDGGTASRFSEPAPDPRLKLYQSDDRQEVIVAYDEFPETKDRPRRRAYALFANTERLAEGKKPHFIDLDEITATIEVPIYDAMPSPAPDSDQMFAILADNRKSFTLYFRNTNLGTMDLPVFVLQRDRVVRILLTPLAVIADATMVGGVVAVMTIEGWGPLLNNL